MKLHARFPFLARENALHDSLIEKAALEAESGRRLAMFDRQTGLFAYWYLQRRFEEEAQRAERYSTPLTVMLIEVKTDEGFRTRDEVTAWLQHELRSTDLASHLGDGRYLAVLTETGHEVASSIAARAIERFPEHAGHRRRLLAGRRRLPARAPEDHSAARPGQLGPRRLAQPRSISDARVRYAA